MSWRETLGGTSAAGDRLTHNSHITHNSRNPGESGNYAYCAHSAYGNSGQECSAPPAPAAHERADGVLHTNYGTGYRHPDGRVDDGTPEPMPPPAEPWPANLDALLRRVATAFEWTRADVADFRQWARRSPEGMADARAFLEAEAARLPVPGLDARHRVVVDMLATDPSLRYAWTCADDGTDPVRLVIAIRGKGTCELALPREKFDALGLPMLIDELTRGAP